MMKLEKNMAVLCIDAAFQDDEELPFSMDEIIKPQKNTQYTIKEVVETNFGVGVRLYGIKNEKFLFSKIQGYKEPLFCVERFEPYSLSNFK